MFETIDLRSDTVTLPTEGMRAAIAAAEVGDDLLGEDPSVNRLQRRFASLVGKEASLFVSSGTMGNQIAIKCHTNPGDELLCDAKSHIIHDEAAAVAAISGVSIFPLPGDRGIFTPEMLECAVRTDPICEPVSKVVLIENTHNAGGGVIWPTVKMCEIATVAKRYGLKMHLDGARLFNAVVATGIPLAVWAEPFDSLTVAFSKGLGAPVGSILAGSKDFIRKSVRVRKMLGGAMRQAGVLAAAAEYALDHHVARLAEDHENARFLALCLAKSPHIAVEGTPETNMVYWRLKAPQQPHHAFIDACRMKGVLFWGWANHRFRAVTHLGVSRGQAERAAAIMCEEAAACCSETGREPNSLAD